MIAVEVVYALPKEQRIFVLELPMASTVRTAIERSGVLAQYPAIDLASAKVGVFGRIVALDSALRAGDRVEIYRELSADQMVARHYPETINDLAIYALANRQHALSKALDTIAAWYAKQPADTVSLLFAWRLYRVADNAEFLDAESLRDYQIGEAAWHAADAQFRREIARQTSF